MNPATVWNDYFAGNHDSVITAGANSVEIMHITGLSLIAMGRYEEASTLLMSSSLVNPRPEWFANACVAFLDAGKPDFALTFALTGIGDFPGDANVCFNAANVFTALDRHHDARGALLKALEADPTHWEAAMNLANAMRRLGDLVGALAYYEQADALNADDLAGKIRTKLNRAVTLCDLGQEGVALKMFDELANDGVASPEMDFNRATLRLKLGEYEDGWTLYQRRWACPMAKEDVAAFQRPMLTSLEEGRGKRVLLCHEQGFGDSIQFVRYAPLMVKAGIDVIILVPSPLERLFNGMGITVVTSRDDIEYDFECPMLNAPMLFGTTVDTIPSSPYLIVPADMVEDRKLPKTGKLKIGVVWAGQARPSPEMKAIDGRRSIDLKLFADLFEMDADFYSLQFGERADDVSQLRVGIGQALHSDFDFLDTAAVIENLDLVIAVDTSTAHLAAALGKPTWLLSRFDGCWRWMTDRNDSPWYPNVLRIFHQKQRGDWAGVMIEVEDALESLIG